MIKMPVREETKRIIDEILKRRKQKQEDEQKAIVEAERNKIKKMIRATREEPLKIEILPKDRFGDETIILGEKVPVKNVKKSVWPFDEKSVQYFGSLGTVSFNDTNLANTRISGLKITQGSLYRKTRDAGRGIHLSAIRSFQTGIAELLIAKIETIARERKSSYVYTYTSNPRFAKILEKLGFKKFGVCPTDKEVLEKNRKFNKEESYYVKFI